MRFILSTTRWLCLLLVETFCRRSLFHSTKSDQTHNKAKTAAASRSHVYECSVNCAVRRYTLTSAGEQRNDPRERCRYISHRTMAHTRVGAQQIQIVIAKVGPQHRT